MKQTNHIRGVDNLVEEINNQNKQECQTMEYNVLLICCLCKLFAVYVNYVILHVLSVIKYFI